MQSVKMESHMTSRVLSGMSRDLPVAAPWNEQIFRVSAAPKIPTPLPAWARLLHALNNLQPHPHPLVVLILFSTSCNFSHLLSQCTGSAMTFGSIDDVSAPISSSSQPSLLPNLKTLKLLDQYL